VNRIAEDLSRPWIGTRFRLPDGSIQGIPLPPKKGERRLLGGGGCIERFIDFFRPVRYDEGKALGAGEILLMESFKRMTPSEGYTIKLR
jgi:hypothetical protein